eukprot:tig00000076_g2400.t1
MAAFAVGLYAARAHCFVDSNQTTAAAGSSTPRSPSKPVDGTHRRTQPTHISAALRTSFVPRVAVRQQWTPAHTGGRPTAGLWRQHALPSIDIRAHDDDDDDHWEEEDADGSRARFDEDGTFESEFEELLHYITRGTTPSLGVRAKSDRIEQAMEELEAFLKLHKKSRQKRIYRAFLLFWHDDLEGASLDVDALLKKKQALVPFWLDVMIDRRNGNIDAAIAKIEGHEDYSAAVVHSLSGSVYDFLEASRDSKQFGTRIAAKTILKDAFADGETLSMSKLYQAASRAESALDEDPFYELLNEIQMLEFETLLEFLYFNIGEE